jgi:hypothetical protein
MVSSRENRYLTKTSAETRTHKRIYNLNALIFEQKRKQRKQVGQARHRHTLGGAKPPAAVGFIFDVRGNCRKVQARRIMI